MRHYRRALLALMLAASSALNLGADAQGNTAKTPDLTGRWALVVEFDSGGGNRGTLVLKQRGEILEGTFTRPTSAEAEVKGTHKGKTVEFSFVTTARDLPERNEATGTLEDDGTIKGRLKSTVKAEGTDMAAQGGFVATRKP